MDNKEIALHLVLKILDPSKPEEHPDFGTMREDQYKLQEQFIDPLKVAETFKKVLEALDR